MLKLKLDRGGRQEVLVIKNRPYMDTVFEIESLVFGPGNTFAISYDADWHAETWVGGELVADNPWQEQWTATFEFTKDQVVTHIRVIKLNEECSIEFFDHMPTDIRKPNKAAMAKVVE